MLNAVSVWLVPLPVLVSISLETKAATLFAPPLAEVQAPANPNVGTAARTAGCPLEFLCSVTMKVLGCGGGGTSLGRLSAVRPEGARGSLDSFPLLPPGRARPPRRPQREVRGAMRVCGRVPALAALKNGLA